MLSTAMCLAAAITACDRADDTPSLRVEVIATRPHDTQSFTEGLEIDGDTLYESTGLSGLSDIRASTLDGAHEFARAELAAPLFGEGITRAGDLLWQLTYRDGIALARDPKTLAELRRTTYEGEGWGLCTRGERIVMSNGGDTLTFRDRNTFAPTGTITLTSHRGSRLNELDCAPDGSVYANAWPTDTILHIDPETGAVLHTIDASALYPRAERLPGADVLNGIAAVPGTDHFLLTGKKWPTTYEVRFTPA